MNEIIELTKNYDGLFQKPGEGVVVKDIKKAYRSSRDEGVEVLTGVSLYAEPHDIIAIVGVSGSGKSTLLNLMGGVDVPDSGSIQVGEQQISTLSQRALEHYRLHHVGFIFQSYNLVPTLNALRNLEFPMTVARVPPSERQERARKLLDIVGLSDKAGKRPDELSGGQQQRVAIGLALANDPNIILADEPTANLDKANMDVVLTLLIALAEKFGKTVIISTHDPRVARLAHRTLTIDEGRIIDTRGNK